VRYRYHMVQLPVSKTLRGPRTGQEMAQELSKTVNHYADLGWEFFRMDQFITFEPSGCLSFGHEPRRYVEYVATFRKEVE
jgi:hypothetical protein